MFPKNAWYVACAVDELAAGPLARTVCGEPLVLYMGPDEVPVALEDFCPHRGAPLSRGSIQDGNLVCGYHGLVMAPDGRCVAMPNQRVAAVPAIRRFAAVARYGYVWLWPGPDTPDVAALPEFDWGDASQWSFGGGVYHVACDYRLMLDNLMDLTHERYLHHSSIGQEEIEMATPDTRVEGASVITSRAMRNVIPPPFWASALEANGLAGDVPCDRWQICRFTPPSHIMIEVGVALAGRGGAGAKPQDKVAATVVDFLTPETDRSMWYFWGMARRFAIDDAQLTDAIRDGQGRIFAEDLAMLEAQQRNLDANPGRALLKLNIDAGGVHARRIIEALL